MTPHLKKIFLLLLPLGFIPYILICFYNNPNADDFLCAAWAQKGPLYQIWFEQYHMIGGRYTSNFLILISPLTFDSFRIYKFTPLLIIVLQWFSIKGLLKSLIGKYISGTDIFICTYLLMFLFIYQMPIISEGLYWYTGQVVYLAGCISATVFLTALIRFFKNQYIFKSKLFHAMLIGTLVIITNGFNEILMLLMNIFIVWLLLILIRKKLPNKGFAICILIISIISSCLVIFAPGVVARSGQYPNNHQFIHSLLWSLAQTGRFFITWVLSAPLCILSFGYYFLNQKLVKEMDLMKRSFYLSPLVSGFLLLIVIFISVFPAYWATGTLGQHRTLNVAYFFFIFLWFVNLTVWINRYNHRLIHINIPKNKTIVILFILLLGCFLFVKNGFNITADIVSGRAAHFEIEMQKRYTLMRSDADTIVFSPIKNPPKSLSFYEVTKDPKNWLNVCWVSYFVKDGKAVVVIKE